MNKISPEEDHSIGAPTYDEITAELHSTPILQQPVIKIPVVPDNFDPMAWIAIVIALDDNIKIDGSLTALTHETQRFKQLVLDKILYMRKHYSTKFSTESFDKMEHKIRKRADCLEKTLESVDGFTKSCGDIHRNLDQASKELDEMGDSCVFQPGISPQIMKLNHIETLLGKTLTIIDQSTPKFTVDVLDTEFYDTTKTELIQKHKEISDRLEYRMTKAGENEDRYDSYIATNNKLCSDRDRLKARINNFTSAVPNAGLNDQGSVVKVS